MKPQVDEGGPPGSRFKSGDSKMHYQRVFGEYGMHGSPKIADAFAMDNPDMENPRGVAQIQIIRNQIFDIFR